MRKKVVWMVVSCLMVLSLVMASCGPAEEEAEVEVGEEEVEVGEAEVEVGKEEEVEEIAPTGPQYGGTFTYALGSNPSSFDPYRTFTTGQPWQGCMISSLCYECLSLKDWTVSRDIFDFKTNLMPEIVWGPGLAESWEFPDTRTIVWHIRKGVHFANVPPVNGRELTADDVKYSLDRITGQGSGFTEKSPFIGPIFDHLDSVTVPDKYTAVFNLNSDAFLGRHEFFSGMLGMTIVAHEAVEEWGSLDDWSTTIGTGPFILTDCVVASTITAEKNPDYWAYDKAYPENKLPYLDTAKFLILSDLSTRLAALRTGKIDLMEGLDWEQTETLLKTNPELKTAQSAMNASGIAMKVDREPFSDVRVRRAMQMAINKEELAEEIYGGYADPTPYGMVGQDGHRVPYEEWPEELKGYYAYDPEGAKKLLADAGYPDGFKTTLTVGTTNTSLYEALIAYWDAINVEVFLEIMEPSAYNSYAMGGHTIMCPTAQGTITTDPPPRYTEVNCSYHPWGSYWNCNDPVYDELYRKSQNAVTLEEMAEWDKEIDMYQIEKAWTVRMPRVSTFNIYQPYLHGYNGEMGFQFGWLLAHFWVEQH